MIADADDRLLAWAGATVSQAAVSLEPPADHADGQGVSLYLLELVAAPSMRGGEGRTPLQLALRYLVTTWAADARAAHELLGQLVAAAMERHDFDAELTPPATELWSALGVRPRPAFLLRVPVRQERPEPERRPVRQPLRVQFGTMAHLAGVVLGPGDVPVSGARVEIPIVGAATETDAWGRFAFPGVPTQPPTLRARVRARGRELDVALDRTKEDQPVVIRFDALGEG